MKSRIRPLVVLLAALAFLAWGQNPATQAPEKDKSAEKDQAAKPAPLPPKPRPRVSLKPKGGTGSNVGDDAPGGGATTAEPSKGGTPGTPSGSFTGPPTKP
ncbi:MAG TPA: hypothetical protein VGJ74_02970 [Burkholderiales bacterium]|jgi:hypothetical protein